MQKRFVYFLISFLVVVSLCQDVWGQELSTQGREFYAAFMKNGYRGCNGSPANDKLTVIVSAPRTCQVNIQSLTGLNTTETVTGGEMSTFTIPVNHCYNDVSEAVSLKALKITSTDTISLFIGNEATNSFDASLVLPAHALGEKYIVQTYTPSNEVTYLCPESNLSCFLVIGTEDSTVVDITPSANTLAGHAANITFSIMLNAGECYQVLSDTSGTAGDLSGSRVESRACKKIALFNGNTLTGIPTGQAAGYDHIFEQAIPINFWGRQFVPTSSLNRQGDFVKITASANNTQVKINGSVVTNLNACESHEFYLTTASEACFVETSMPSVVYLYNTTHLYDGSTLGDPSMIWIAPIEQQINEIMFCTFSAQSISAHYVNIVMPTSGIPDLRLDGTLIASGNIYPLTGNNAYSYARIPITAGTHTLQSDGGFFAFIYGFGNAQGYGYAVGAKTVPSENNILVNQRPAIQIPEDYLFCVNEPVDFSIYSQYIFDTITWMLENQSPLIAEEFTHTFSDTGSYHLTAIVTFNNSDCIPPYVDTLTCQVRVANFERLIIDTVCSETTYNRHGFHFTANRDTIVTHTVPTGHACDSIISLQLKVNPLYSQSFIQHIEQEDLPFLFGGNSYSAAGHYTVNFLTDKGCDSIYSFQLIVHQDYIFPSEASICEGDSYFFRGRELTAAGVYYDSLQTVLGDDSVYKLTLYLNPVYETRLEAEICEGDTFHFQGNTLTAPGEYQANLRAQTNCDSIIILQLTVKPSYHVTEHVNLCPPNYYYFHGDTLRESGVYTVPLLTVDGCDSVLTLILYFADPPETVLEDVVCLNEYYQNHNLTVPPHTEAGTYYYEFTLTDPYGCDSIIRLTLTVPDVRVTIASSPEDFCDNHFTVLHAITPNNTVIWNTGESSFSIEVTTPGTYQAVVSEDACLDRASYHIEHCPFNVFLPNAISAGGADGINDAFFLINANEIKEMGIMIYDRWGTLVFYSEDPHFRWDGTVNGKSTVNQLFNYVLFVTPIVGKKQKITGTVTVL